MTPPFDFEFWAVPRVIAVRTDLTSSDKLLTGVLATRAGENGHSWPSITKLARDTGMSRRGVIKSLQRLATAGFVVVEGGGKGTVNDYRLTLPTSEQGALVNKVRQCTECTATSEQSAPQLVNKVHPKRKGKRKGKRTTPLPPRLDCPDFRKAWADWAQHRAEIRKPLTPTTASRQLKKLAKYDPATAVAMLEQSIERGWAGLFEIKTRDGSSRGTFAPAKTAGAGRYGGCVVEVNG